MSACPVKMKKCQGYFQIKYTIKSAPAFPVDTESLLFECAAHLQMAIFSGSKIASSKSATIGAFNIGLTSKIFCVSIAHQNHEWPQMHSVNLSKLLHICLSLVSMLLIMPQAQLLVLNNLMAMSQRPQCQIQLVWHNQPYSGVFVWSLKLSHQQREHWQVWTWRTHLFKCC